MYRGPLLLTLGAVVQGPFYALRGVLAECSAATSFARAYIIPSIDLLSPRVQKGLDVYIDDYGYSVQARPRPLSVWWLKPPLSCAISSLKIWLVLFRSTKLP
eukprot:9459053-Pyramimonas_sp.AAC.1